MTFRSYRNIFCALDKIPRNATEKQRKEALAVRSKFIAVEKARLVDAGAQADEVKAMFATACFVKDKQICNDCF